MRTLLKILSPLLLAAAFVLVYTLHLYRLCSVIYLLTWLLFLLAGAYCRSRRMLRFGVVCWLLILVGFALVLLFPVAEPELPAGLASLRVLYYTLFLLPLSGLPALHVVCIPLSLLMLALHVPAYRYLRRMEARYEI